ncbi:MAG: methyltransferase domain-containing protein [Akkermansiaceae bacterium]|nr:methyltransferase domain-containing protein [Akkermansiaceae bacterium]
MTNWEERYQIGDTPWEKGQAAPPLLELLRKMEANEWGDGPILVPGCGLGHDVRALAELRIPVVGVDLSPFAVSRAGEFHPIGREIYELADFLDPDWRAGRQFSAVWEHTCFCAIDPSQRARYAQVVADCLEEGGLLAGVFFLTPHDPGDEKSGPPFETSIEELDQWFSPNFQRVDGWVPAAAYPGREGREWIGLFRKKSQPSVAGETGCR